MRLPPRTICGPRKAGSLSSSIKMEVHDMQNYNYLIIGGGMTADAAVNGIREVDSKGSIGLISSDSDPPYDRPPLTKSLWKGKPLESVWRNTKDRKVDLYLGRTAKDIDRQHNTV